MSQVRVDLLSDASSAISDAGSLDARLKDISKSAQQVARETSKGADQTAGSYAKLRTELASNKKSLEQLEIGSEAFAEQATVVQQLEAGVKAAKEEIVAATKAAEDFGDIAEPIKVAEGSIDALTANLKEATQELNKLDVGSDAFAKQADVVRDLSMEVDTAKDAIKEATQAAASFEDIAEPIKVAEGSIEGLSQSLKEATDALNLLEPATEEFERQGEVVADLSKDLDKAKQSAEGFTSAGKNARELANAVAVADDSVESLERNLKDANSELKRTARGTPEYRKQAAEVKKLAKELDKANKELKQFTGQDTGVKAMRGSLAQLESELADNVAQLRNLKVGTAEFDKQKASVDRLAASVANVQKKASGSGGISSKVGASVKDFATSIAGFGTITGGLIAAANLLKAEFEDVKRRDSESLAAVRTREQSIASLVQNAGGTLTDSIVDRAEATSGVTGADVDKLLSISSSVASAGITSAEEIVDIAQTALRSQGGDAGQGAAVAGAAIDLSSTLGISVKEAFGVLFQTAGAARPEDIALLGKAAVKATAALTGAGVGAEEAQELFAATTLLTGDKTGEQAVSISNDLTQAFRKFQKEGIPETIEVAGEDVEVNVPKRFSSLLRGEGLKQLELDDLLDLTRKSPELEKVFESFLPNSQNRAFTEQIVGGSEVFDSKLAQSSDAIDLVSAGARTDQQVADVEGRRVTGVLTDLVDAALDRNLQDQSAALDAVARDTFTKVLARTDSSGVDYVSDGIEQRFAEGRELAGQGVAEARAGALQRQLDLGKVGGKDVETTEAAILVLRQIQSLTDAADNGRLSARAASSELDSLKKLLKGLFSQDEGERRRAQRQAEAQQPIAVAAPAPDRQPQAAKPVAVANPQGSSVATGGGFQVIEPFDVDAQIAAVDAIATERDRLEAEGLSRAEATSSAVDTVTGDGDPPTDLSREELNRQQAERHEQQQATAAAQTEAMEKLAGAIGSQKPPETQTVRIEDAGPVESQVPAAGVL